MNAPSMSTSLSRPWCAGLRQWNGCLVQRARGVEQAEITSDVAEVATHWQFQELVRTRPACRGSLLSAESIIDARLAGGRPVLGICVGLQLCSRESSTAHRRSRTTTRSAPVLRTWAGTPLTSRGPLLTGVESERFYFVHSYGVVSWDFPEDGRFGDEATGGFLAHTPTASSQQ